MGGKRPGGKRPGGKRHGGQKVGGQKVGGQKTRGQKTGGQKTGGQKSCHHIYQICKLLNQCNLTNVSLIKLHNASFSRLKIA